LLICLLSGFLFLLFLQKIFMKILLLNGPNLNMLGKREPQIYGSQTFDDYLVVLKSLFPDYEMDYVQSNHEGVLIDVIQQAEGHYDGIVFNPGGYSHTSIALADAVRCISVPVVEVHISNIYERESYRRHSFVAEAAVASVVGKGLQGYADAVSIIADRYK